MSYSDKVLDQAEQLIAEGKHDDAQAMIAPILEAEPSNPRAWAVLADATQDAAEAAGYRAKVVELAKAATTNLSAQQQSYQSGSLPPPQPYQQPPPMWYPPQPQQKKSSIIGPVVFSLLVVVGVFCAIGWVSGGNKPSASRSFSSSSSSSSTVKIVYKITGSGKFADLTYTNETGATEQRLERLPWTKTFTINKGDTVYVSAQANGIATVECAITADGDIVQKAKSSGEYVIATCSGLIR